MFSLITFIVLGLDLWFWYRMDRLARRLAHARLWRTLLAIFMASMSGYSVWFVLARWVVTKSYWWMPTFLTVAAFIWHLLILPVAALILVLGGSIGAIISALRRKKPTPATSGVSRRGLLTGAAVAAPPLILAGLTGVSLAQLGNFRIRRMGLALPNLPVPLRGFTIALVADIHTGYFTNQRMLNSVAARTNDLRADMILLLGDLVNISLADLPAAMEMVNKLDAPWGVHMIEGNHDIIQSERKFVDYCGSHGMPVMLEESKFPSARLPLQLLSIKYNREDAALAEAVARVAPLRQEGAFPILLSHHPHAWDYARAHGLPLVLSGHTHGGQIMLTDHIGAGPIRFRYWTGLYQRDNSSLIVSNGVGNWFPLRVNAPAEIIHLTLG